MAKKAATTATKRGKKTAPAKKNSFPPRRDKEEFPYGVDEAAKALGMTTQSVRASFRKHGVEKEGSTYAWKTQKAMDAAIKPCRAE